MRILTIKKVLIAFASIAVMQTAFANEHFTPGHVIAGPENAPLTIEEFMDFECPFCVRGSNTMREILKSYPGKIKLVLRNRPLPFHEHSNKAARAFLAVYKQSPSIGVTYQKEIFEQQDKLKSQGEKFLFELAEKLGVNLSVMKTDMESAEVSQSIADDEKLADINGMQGTPSFKIGSEVVVGALPYNEIKKIVDSQLAK